MERTREIGILRAIGWPKKRIVAMVMCESCGLAIVASAIGCIVAIILVRLLSEAPAAKGILSPTIAPAVILQGVVLSLCIGLIGAILPAIRAAGMLPSEAFRASS
jgi:putative ABC transport system permease protein